MSEIFQQSRPKEVVLRPLTSDNIDDVLANGDSNSEFYDLPSNEDEAANYLHRIRNNVRHGIGNVYNAYDVTAPEQIVGGGQVVSYGSAINIGYWVVFARRRQGYGNAILGALEDVAIRDFPDRRRIELVIDQRNMGSQALASLRGYELLEVDEQEDGIVFQKVLADSGD